MTRSADILGVARRTLDAIVNGRAGISLDTAIRISKAFGGTPEVWLKMQNGLTGITLTCYTNL